METIKTNKENEMIWLIIGIVIVVAAFAAISWYLKDRKRPYE